DAMKAVDAGHADASVEVHAVFNYYIGRYYFTDLISHPIIDSPVLANTPQYLGIRKDRPILKSILDKAMVAVTEEEYQEIQQRWFLSSNIASAGLSSSEASYLQGKGQIQMCVDPDWMPLEAILDGQHMGMSADFFKVLSVRIGVPISLVKTKTWLDSIEQFKQRQCDILSLAVETPDQLQYADFTQPYLELPLVIATRERTPFIADIADVYNQEIGIVKSHELLGILRNQYPDLQIVEVESLDDGLRQVSSGNLFGYIDVLPPISYSIQRRYPSLKIAGRLDQPWALGIAIRNDEPELLSIFEKAIASIDERDKQNIINTWISVRYEQGIDYRLIHRLLFISLTVLAIVLYRQYLLQTYNRKLEKISVTDPLTGCCNRLKTETCLHQQESLFNRYQQTFSVILCDVDHFKKVNDTFGHLAGDAVLIETVMLFKRRLRSTDILGRWGGEEFLIIAPNTNLSAAMTLAEALRQQMANHKFSRVGQQTASFGVAEFHTGVHSISHLISQADEALYKAKARERNCVVAYQERQTL
ncbi:MAG: diguanylate cyclase, partial [Cyanothece sp. SIO2G6]|nr:diguanylate cyclase [Cyanothece sp. SIO2G6]